MGRKNRNGRDRIKRQRVDSYSPFAVGELLTKAKPPEVKPKPVLVDPKPMPNPVDKPIKHGGYTTWWKGAG